MYFQKSKSQNISINYFYILIINLFYSILIIITKLISDYPLISWGLILGLSLVFLLFFIYAVVWQQLLKKVSLSVAYMFKGSSIVFIVLASWLVFNESISLNNLLGCCLIIIGIVIMFFKK